MKKATFRKLYYGEVEETKPVIIDNKEEKKVEDKKKIIKKTKIKKEDE